MFYVGQKVVCVDAAGSMIPPLVEGNIYTIATIRWLDEKEVVNPGLGVTLIELPTFRSKEYCAEYRIERFRPLVEKKTDISIFKEILNKVNTHEPA